MYLSIVLLALDYILDTYVASISAHYISFSESNGAGSPASKEKKNERNQRRR